MPATQANREISVTCALGADVLLFRRMTGTEQLGALSEYNLDLLSERADLNIDDLLATLLTVSVDLPQVQGGQRHFNGFVTRFALTGRQGRYSTYQATVRPWLWFLTRSADCRIFQDKTVIEIIKAVFEPYTVADFDVTMLEGEYAAMPYCVQYRETDFNFVSRLMEKEGIYYYFKSELGRHTMVLADSYGAHQPIPNFADIPYATRDDDTMKLSEVMYDWTMGGEVQPGAYVLRDYDFEKPTASSSSLLVRSALVRSYDQSTHEIFDYPGKFVVRAKGESYAQARIEAMHTRYERVYAGSNARGVFPGGLFKLTGHPRADQNSDYLVVSAEYALASDFYEPVPPKEPSPVFVCSLSAIPKEHAYRPDCTARKPYVRGPQTAMVVGKAGEEIWTDKYGRVKVQFHWDRVGPEDETSSCWVRVLQGWAGKRWGIMFIPRIGHEVVVSFLEGDPDQPLITGSVYNAEAMPPYTLPDHATRSTIKSNSSKGGQGYNEIRFEDKKGSEQIFIHAEKNQDNRVKNDSLEWIGNNRHLVVTQHRHEKIGGDAHLAITGNYKMKITGNTHKTVTGSYNEKIDGGMHSAVTGDHNEKVDGGRNTTITGDNKVKVDGTLSQDVGMAIQNKAGTKFGVDAGTDIHIKAGTNVVIEAGVSITLKAGGGSVVIGPTSVSVTGTPILLNSGGSAGSGSGVSVSAPAAPTAPTDPEAPTDADDGTT